MLAPQKSHIHALYMDLLTKHRAVLCPLLFQDIQSAGCHNFVGTITVVYKSLYISESEYYLRHINKTQNCSLCLSLIIFERHAYLWDKYVN